MRPIEIGVNLESVEVIEQVRRLTEQVAELLQQANDLQKESNALNLQAKRLVMENVRLLRTVANRPSLQVEDDDGGT